MNLLLGLTDNKDITIVQAFLLLKSRGIFIEEVNYIRTLGLEIDSAFKKFYTQLDVIVNTSGLINCGIISTEKDYIEQENDLINWYINQLSKKNNLYVFIGGGHKLHSLALQKCAFLLGAEDVFHMFVNVPRGMEPHSISEVELTIKNGKILYSSLGKFHGWPAIKSLLGGKFKSGPDLINIISQKIGTRTVDQINEFPFESIQLLPAQAIHWLMQPAETDDYKYIESLPKVELHCHLGGFATDGELLDEVRNRADKSIPLNRKLEIQLPDKWPEPESPIGLKKYMDLGNNSGSYILKNKGCLVKQIDLLYQHLLDQNIGYAEIRCSPMNYISGKISGLDVLKIIQDRFDLNMAKANKKLDFWCHVNLIIIASRRTDGNSQNIDDHLSLAVEAESSSNQAGRCKIVAVDLAGYEHKETRASYYGAQFEPIHRRGIALTIHAGENDEAEGIWEAVFKLNTRRIGHGLNLYQDQNLLRSVINRRIGIEMCPYANYQIKGYWPMNGYDIEYPLQQYLKQGAQVTINTDNIGISKANLTENFVLAGKMNPDLTRMNILQMIRNGLEQAFIDVALRNRLIQEYNKQIFEITLNRAWDKRSDI